jgi:PIN domain nuclease of toxin-antitoxin system
MKLLIDSHVVVWWVTEPNKLTSPARAAISNPDNEVFISAASIWELGLKQAKGKLRMPEGYEKLLRADGFSFLSITAEHATVSGTLPPHHGDPFDRILIAQAIKDSLVLVTRDAMIPLYSIPMITA